MIVVLVVLELEVVVLVVVVVVVVFMCPYSADAVEGNIASVYGFAGNTVT